MQYLNGVPTQTLNSLPYPISNAAEALAYSKLVPPTIILPTGITGGVADLAAGGGAAGAYQIAQNEFNTTATGSAVCGARYNLAFMSIGATRNRIDFDDILIAEVLYERQQSVANSVAYFKVSADSGNGALASKGMGVSFANLAATLDVYDTSLHATSAGWSITASQTTRITLIHIPTVGAYLYTDDTQRVSYTANLLSGDPAAGHYVVLSLANGVTATDQYFWHGAVKLWVARS